MYTLFCKVIHFCIFQNLINSYCCMCTFGFQYKMPVCTQMRFKQGQRNWRSVIVVKIWQTNNVRKQWLKNGMSMCAAWNVYCLHPKSQLCFKTGAMPEGKLFSSLFITEGVLVYISALISLRFEVLIVVSIKKLSLLACDAMQFARQVPTFWRNLLSPYYQTTQYHKQKE